jgi:ABC-type glycerol-3-phosphate transport system permease component
MDPAARARVLVLNVVKYGSLITASLIAIVPIFVIVMASLKTTPEFLAATPLAPPGNWLNFDNYLTAFNQGGMLQAFANTTFILVLSVAGSVLIGSMAAFAISRFEFRLKRVIVFLFLLAALVPPITAQVATFVLIVDLGLYNTRWAAIVLYTSTDIISIYIFLQFMRGIPRSLDEAAILEGASQFTVYRRVVFPLLKPAIATVVIIKGVAVYNDFYIPWLYMKSKDLGTVATSLQKFKGPFDTRWEVIAAGAVIAIIPTLIVFLFLQRYIYNGFTRGITK